MELIATRAILYKAILTERRHMKQVLNKGDKLQLTQSEPNQKYFPG